jgi:hypothetical protein
VKPIIRSYEENGLSFAEKNLKNYTTPGFKNFINQNLCMRLPLAGFAILALMSCKVGTGSDKKYSDSSKTYKLQLNLLPGSKLHYQVSSETDMKIETESKKIENINKTDAGVIYEINKDSAGNFQLKITYDKLHTYTKTGDDEKEMDAANAVTSMDPIEKILGELKNATIRAVVSPQGEVKSVSGYKEIGEKLIQSVGPEGSYERTIAQKKWEEVAGENTIKKSIDDIFRIFPDSLVHVGDKWKLFSKRSGELPMLIKSFYKLEEIENDIGLITSAGDIVTDSSSSSLSQYAANINGTQKGQYHINVKTGMLLSAEVSAKLQGNVVVMGREVPVKIKSKVKVEGKKLN